MKTIHMKQRVIVSALAGAILIPGSAMAAEESYGESSPVEVAGIESTQNDKGEYLEKTMATVIADILNVRGGQGTEYPILLQIAEHETYEVNGTPVNGWYPVTVDGVDGWVSGEWVTVETSYYKEETEQILTEAVQETAAIPSQSTAGQEVIDFACQFIGNPYVWGGTSLTEGADCSGFVQSVYANFGVYLPRTTWDMEYVGYEVSYEQAQPGDLVLYDGHVGLYMGDGNIVNAMNESDGIGICTATYAPIITVRRVL